MAREMELLKYFDDGTLIMGKCGSVFITVERKKCNEKGTLLRKPIRIDRQLKSGYRYFAFDWITVVVHRMQWVLHNRIPVPIGFEVGHIDESRNYNYLSNLKLMTHKENCNFPKRKERISFANKGEKHHLFGKHLSEETKNKIRIANAGTDGPHYGKKLSAETIRKCVLANTGKKRSEESKKRISEALKGRTFSTETKKKMSAAAKLFQEKRRVAGTNKLSEETRRRMSAAKTLEWSRKTDSEKRRRSEEACLKTSASLYSFYAAKKAALATK